MPASEATGRARMFAVAEAVYDVMRARTSLPVNVDFFSAVVYDALGRQIFANLTVDENLLLVEFHRLETTPRRMLLNRAEATILGLIPIVGGFILLYFYISEGTPGPNRFGPDPEGADAAAFA